MKTIAELAEAHGKNFAEPYQARINFLAGAKAMQVLAASKSDSALSAAEMARLILEIPTEP